MSKLTSPMGHQPVGAIPWGRQAYGWDASGNMNASDLDLALLYTLGYHVLATRDVTLLSALVPWNGSWYTVEDAAWLTFLYVRDSISVGSHGLLHLHYSDHNDGLLGNLGISGDNFTTAINTGESVMNSAYGAYVLPIYAAALELKGGLPERPAEVRAFAAQLLSAVVEQWVPAPASDPSVLASPHGWFRRVYLGSDTLGWRGDPNVDGVMWTETQAWALLAGAPEVATINATVLLLEAIAALAQGPSPTGAINAGPVVSESPRFFLSFCVTPFIGVSFFRVAVVDAGYGYGGVWYCGNLALIAALGLRGAPVSDALAEWRKNALGTHANAYPGVWFGATSGPDVYNSVLSNEPGGTRCAWGGPGVAHPCNEASVPVFNLWSHTLPTFALPGIIGFVPSAAGYSVRAGPASDGRLTIYTPLVSLVMDNVSAGCNISGHYAPLIPPGQRLLISVELAVGEAALCAGVTVNGELAELTFSQGTVSFNATTVPGPQVTNSTSGGPWSVILWQLFASD